MRILRILLPTAAIVVLIGSLFWPQIAPRQDRIGVDTAPVGTGSGKDAEAIVNASYSGVDSKGRPFTVRAEAVHSPPEEENVLQLSRPDAVIALLDGTQVTVVADDGVYLRDQGTLDLHGAVTLRRGPDLTVQTASATIRLKTSSAAGDQPVAGSAAFGNLSGQGFRVEDGGDTVFVGGPARMLIRSGRALK